MKLLVIGRGSMGRRRIRDLTALGQDVTSWDGLDGPFDIGEMSGRSVVISTPPMSKGGYAELAQYNLSHFFTEADIEQVERIKNGIYLHFPSCTPLFVPAIRHLRERVERGEVGHAVAYTHHTGQHLLDWHPGADLSTYYAAQRATGAAREMIPFELIWLTAIFGPVRTVKSIGGKVGNLPCDIEDVFHLVLEHEGGALGHLMIDALSRPARREITVVGTHGVITQPIVYTEAAYLAEMRAFVSAIEKGTTWPYTPEQEAANLCVLHAIVPTD